MLKTKIKLGKSPLAQLGKSAENHGKAQLDLTQIAHAIDQEAPFGENPWVYSATDRIADMISMVPLKLERHLSSGWTACPRHGIQRILNNPNTRMTGQELTKRWAQHVLLYGNAIAWFNKSEVWPIIPLVRPMVSNGVIIGFQCGDHMLPAEEVVHWMMPSPMTVFWGKSPFEALRNSVEVHASAEAWAKAGFDGESQKAFLFGDLLSEDEMKDTTKSIKNQKKKRSDMVLGGVDDVKEMGRTARELGYAESRKFSREEVIAVLGMPPALLSIENIDADHMDSAEKLFWQTKGLPLLHTLCSGWERALFKRFSLEPSQWRISPDISEIRVLQRRVEDAQIEKMELEAKKIQAETLEKLIESGVRPAKAAALTGIPMISWKMVAIVAIIILLVVFWLLGGK